MLLLLMRFIGMKKSRTYRFKSDIGVVLAL